MVRAGGEQKHGQELSASAAKTLGKDVPSCARLGLTEALLSACHQTHAFSRQPTLPDPDPESQRKGETLREDGSFRLYLVGRHLSSFPRGSQTLAFRPKGNKDSRRGC